MDHPHVARLSDVYQDETDLYFVMEVLEGGELFDKIQKLRRFTEIDAASALWQMLLVVNYLHGRNIMHRDLKPENFLYDKKGSDHLKLIDFGFSRAHRQESAKMRLVCGTTPYMAPEVIQGSYDLMGDLWSIGVITYILNIGTMPFAGSSDQELKNVICEGAISWPEPLPKNMSPELQDLISKLLEVDPAKRLSAEEALKHPWLEIRDRKVSKEQDAQQMGADVLDAFASFSGSSKFRRHVLGMCAWSLSNDQRAHLRDAFEAIDTDHTGTISLAELKQALEQNNCMESSQSDELFSGLHMEQIDYSDFLAAMLSSRIAAHESTIRNAFRRFDVDSNGVISGSDLRAVLGKSHKKSEIDDLVKSMDTDGDGQISFDEFLEYLSADEADESHKVAAEDIIEDEIKRSQTAVGIEKSLLRVSRHEAPPQHVPEPEAKAVVPAPTPSEKSHKSSVCSIL